MTIRICNYEIMNFKDSDLIITEKGLSRITSNAMLEALHEIEPHIGTEIAPEKIKKILTNKRIDTANGMAFLSQNLGILESPPKRPFKKVIVIHDNEMKSISLKILKNEITCESLFLTSETFSTSITQGQKNLIIIISESYHYHRLQKQYFDIATSAPESAIMVGYYTPEHYCTSPPYISQIGNPCHFCDIDRLLSNEERKSSNNNWAQLLRFSHQNDGNIPNRKINILQQSLASGLLVNRINLLTNHSNAKRHQDNALSFCSIHLSTGFIEELSTPHWMLCRCQRGVQ